APAGAETCGYITQAPAPFLLFYCASNVILRNNPPIIIHFKQENRSAAVMPTDLCRYDLKILAALQENAATRNQQLAGRIGLSPSPCSRRVKQLEEAGYILRQAALLDPHKLGLTLTAFVMVGMHRHTPDRFAHFEDTIRQCPEVLNCALVTGMDADYQLRVVVQDMDHYQQFLLGTLTRIEGVSSVRSSFVLNQVVSSTELPLNHLVNR